MKTILIQPQASESRYLALAQDCARHFEVWTLMPLPTYFQTVKDMFEKRPTSSYEIHLMEQGIGSPMTLFERMSLELVYFKETGAHWGSEFWTICASSRCYGTYIPVVRWFRGVFSCHFIPPHTPMTDAEMVYVLW